VVPGQRRCPGAPTPSRLVSLRISLTHRRTKSGGDGPDGADDDGLGGNDGRRQRKRLN
jgi:hypothetical protein